MVLYFLLAALSAVLIVYAFSSHGSSVFFRRFAQGRRLRLMFVVAMAVVLCSLIILIVHSSVGHSASGWQVVVPTTVALLAVFGLLIALLKDRIAGRIPTDDAQVILAIGAHPDDLEIACGGTLARLSDAGHKVYAIVMSDGRAGGDNGVRPDEARMGAVTMGITSIDVHSFTDTRLEDHNVEMVQVVEEKINALCPDLIFTHSIHDQHQDHQSVHLAVLRAARKHSSILCYESPSVTSEFNPQLFIDITDYIDVKVKAVEDHRDQAGKRYLRGDRLRGMANFRGAQGKVELAEGFEVIRLKDSIAGLR